MKQNKGVCEVNHRRKKKKTPTSLEKAPNRVERIVEEEKPKEKETNKFVVILLGILLSPLILWGVLEGSKNKFSLRIQTVLLILFVLFLITIGVGILEDR